MKKQFFFLFTMVLSLAFSTAYADTRTDCINDMKRDGGHCVYFSGLSDKSNEGRYIKYYMPDFNYNLVTCITGGNENLYFISLPRLGNHTDEFYICTSAIGDQCELVSKDSYSAVRNENKIITDPQTFEVKLAAVRDKYPACVGTWVNV